MATNKNQTTTTKTEAATEKQVVDNLAAARQTKSENVDRLRMVVSEALASADFTVVFDDYDGADQDKVIKACIDQFTSEKWGSLAYTRACRSVRTKKQVVRDLLAGKEADVPEEVKKAAELLKAFVN